MGEAKQRKERLGKWYGQPIGPGHPDFVPSKKPEPVPPLVRFSANDSDEPPIDIGAETVSLFREDGRIVVDRLFSLYTGEPLGTWFSGNEGKGILFTGSIARRVELKEVDDRKAVFAWLGIPQEEPNKSEPIESPSDERRTQEEPNATPQRPVRVIPDRRRIPIIFSALAVAMIGMSSIPEPEYRPKKR